ncbi:MAG: invasion associated locus B family protein [Alphaproteobacteria bacterium]|nr:invasion associated locus B family protein [Alphaproteobacteria bacterium]
MKDFKMQFLRCTGAFQRILLAYLLFFLFPCSTHAQDKVQKIFGDWSIMCDLPPGARKKQCAMVQSVVAENQENVGLAVSLLRTMDKQKQLLRIVAPLGVWLPPGLVLKIDGVDVSRIRFERCVVNGCFAEIELLPDLQSRLEKNRSVTFIIFKTPEQGIGIPVSLKGFKKALAYLK